MKKLLLWLLIVSMIAVFSLAGCKAEAAEEVTGEEAVEVVEEEAEEVIAEKEIQKGEGYIIENEDFGLLIYENSLTNDDSIRILKYKNDIIENNNAIFSDEAYSIEFNASNFFNKPVRLALKYDESMIPEDLSEFSVFVAFEDKEGSIFYQGGEIDTEANTIMVESLHASKWFTGIFKKSMRIIKGDVVESKNIDKYREDSLELFDDAIQLILEDPNFNNIEYAREEWERRWEEFEKWLITADITVKKLEEVNPASSLKDLVEFVSEEGLSMAEGEILNVLPGMLSILGLTSEAAVIMVAGKVVGVISAVKHGIFIGENVAWSALTIEKIIRMKNAFKELRIASLAWDYLASKGIFLTDLNILRENGIDVPQDKINKVISIIDKERERISEEEATEVIKEEKTEKYKEITNIIYTVIYGPVIDGDYCVYRVRLDIVGDYKSFKWNRDDSNGAWGQDIAQINLSPGESFSLRISIDDYFDEVHLYYEDFYYEDPAAEEETIEVSKGILLMNGKATYIAPESFFEDYPMLISLEIDLDTGNVCGNMFYEGPDMGSQGFVDVIIEGPILGNIDLNTKEIYFEATCNNHWPSQDFITISKWSGKLNDENNSASGTYFFDEWIKGEWSVSK